MNEKDHGAILLANQEGVKYVLHFEGPAPVAYGRGPGTMNRNKDFCPPGFENGGVVQWKNGTGRRIGRRDGKTKVRESLKPLPESNAPKCFVCGQDNDKGLKLKFYRLDEDTVTAELVPPPEWSGWEGLIAWRPPGGAAR